MSRTVPLWIFLLTLLGLVLISALIILYWLKKFAKKDITVFDLSDPEEFKAFYDELFRSYQAAREEIFLTGTGFVSASNSQIDLIEETIKSTGIALYKNIKIIRLQMSSSPSEEWANQFADLMEKFPSKLNVFESFDNIELANTALIDPDGREPIVQILFESEETGIANKRLDVSIAVFIYKQPRLAKVLKKRFLARVEDLKQLLPNEVRDLGLGVLYFAYGSNLLTSQMNNRCPSAIIVGTGILYDWGLAFGVPAPHLNGNAVGIYPSEGNYVWGVVYAMSKEDKLELDRIEQGGYYPVSMDIKMKGSQNHLNNVIVYRPATVNPVNGKPFIGNVKLMIQGAKEHNLTELASNLEYLIKDDNFNATSTQIIIHAPVNLTLEDSQNELNEAEKLNLFPKDKDFMPDEKQKFRMQISQHFNLGEIKIICFDLNVPFENLGGNTLNEQVVELIEFCDRNNLRSNLIMVLKKHRPAVEWDKMT